MPNVVVAEDIDLLERGSRRQHLEQLRLQRRLLQAQMQRIKYYLAGTRTARLAPNPQGLLVIDRKTVEREELVAVNADCLAVEQRESHVVVQRRHRKVPYKVRRLNHQVS